MVIWVVGMSGAGKTAIGKAMHKLLRSSSDNPWVLLDGDTVRDMMGNDLGYGVNARRRNGERMMQLCALLDRQGINVIACILSLFHEHQLHNRKTIRDYREVYIKANLDVLKQRDNKQLYRRAEAGEINDVVGIHIPFPEPVQPDHVVDNHLNASPPEALAREALESLGMLNNIRYRYADQNLLDRPFKYQYLPIEGEWFLGAYRANREETTDKIKCRMNQYLKAREADSAELDPSLRDLASYLMEGVRDKVPGHVDRWIHDVALELLPRQGREFLGGHVPTEIVSTRHYLVTELLDLSRSTWRHHERSEPLLTLLKRFEVSKKIFTCYGSSSFNKVTDDYSDFLNFPIFQLLLLEAARHVDKFQALIFQNAALKTGDILSSAWAQAVTPGQMALTFAALHAELQSMQKHHHV